EAKLHRLKLRNNMAFHAQGAGRVGDAEPWFREAAKIGEELIDKWPKIPEFRSLLIGVYTNLGHLLLQAGRFGEAVNAFKMALAPRDRDRALELARRAGQKEPNNGEVWRAAGLVQLRKGDGPSAIESLLKARQLFHGRDCVTDLLLALAYAQAGNDELARMEY